MVREEDGAAVFFRPDGSRLEVASPAPPGTDRDPWLTSNIDGTDATLPCSIATRCWDGEPLDVVWAVDVLRAHRELRAERDDGEA